MSNYVKMGFGPAMRLGLVAALALSTGCAALARGPGTWQCAAANGQVDRKAAPLGSATTSVSGQIVVHKASFGPANSSIARIAFTDSKLPPGDCRCNGIFVKAFADFSTVGFYMLVDGEAVELAQAPYEKPITFNFALDPQGQLTARVGKTSPVIRTAAPRHLVRDSLVMSCSGTDVSFLDVTQQ